MLFLIKIPVWLPWCLTSLGSFLHYLIQDTVCGIYFIYILKFLFMYLCDYFLVWFDTYKTVIHQRSLFSLLSAASLILYSKMVNVIKINLWKSFNVRTTSWIIQVLVRKYFQPVNSAQDNHSCTCKLKCYFCFENSFFPPFLLIQGEETES